MNVLKQVLVGVLIVFGAICAAVGLVTIIVPNTTKARLDDSIRELDAYCMYYLAVEDLLDSAGVDVDSPLLETDCGSTYLDAKMYLDSIYSMNHPGGSLTMKVVQDSRIK